MAKSYGTVVIQDGVYIRKDPALSEAERRQRRGVARYYEEVNREIYPQFTSKSNGTKTFDVSLNYNDYKYAYKEGRRSYATNINIDYSKNYKRISGKNVLRDVKNFVSEYAGCCEASKLRKRIIALEKIHDTISNVNFKFSLGTSFSPRPIGFEVTISSPAIFTVDNHGFSIGYALRFLTSGYLPDGLEVKKNYFIVEENFSSNTFSVSENYLGTPINTTGSQSGLHSLIIIT